MCFRSGAWVTDAGRDVSAPSQAPAVTSQARVDVENNVDGCAGNTWTAAAGSTTGDVMTAASPSPAAVSELVDKGVVYLRDRIFNRDSGKKKSAPLFLSSINAHN